MLTHRTLRNMLRYYPTSGRFVWRVSRGRIKHGAEAGTKTWNDYIKIGIMGRDYMAHVLAWFYMTGEFPIDQIDHQDQNKSNNRWKNLRLASAAKNGANRGPNKNNRYGVKGVYWSEKKHKWCAFIMVSGKSMSLGSHERISDAKRAYMTAARRYFGAFARAA